MSKDYKIKDFHKVEFLHVLGIETCLKCKKHLSINNSRCYNCDFEEDDEKIHEAVINRKYQRKIDFDESLYLVFNTRKGKQHYHILKNGDILSVIPK